MQYSQLCSTGMLALALAGGAVDGQHEVETVPTMTARLPVSGAYSYQVVARGVRDADGRVDVASMAAGASVTAKTTLQFMSTYLIAGSAIPQYAYSQTYYASTLQLSGDAQPVAVSLEIRPDTGSGHRTYSSATLTPEGVNIMGSRRRTLHAAAGSDRWVTIDGLNYAGAFALASTVLAANGSPLTIYSVLSGNAAAYICTSEPPPRPKDVPATDAYLRCTGGRNDAVVWYDSDTLVPDKIELPYERATLFRRR